jgi:hypothetical protein
MSGSTTEERPTRGPAEQRFFGIAGVVDSSIRCVITRMRLRRPWHLVSAYRTYRSLHRAAERRQVPGLLKTTFLVEDLRTCYSMSVWDGQPAFSAFVEEHVDAVNRVFGHLAYDEERGPELWSTTWQLSALSHNQRWGDLDLLARIGSDRLTFEGAVRSDGGIPVHRAGGETDGP